ncbi:hypothetical protein GCM10018952_00930 [Streptosporangium vulgare]
MFEYAPAPESRDVVDIRPSYGLFIGGEWVDSQGDNRNKTVNPASEEVLAEVAWATEADVDRAVQAARKAFGVWSALPGSERAKYLFRIARIIQERSRELAVLESPGQRQADPRVPRRGTCPWWRPTSSTTPAGPTSSTTPGTDPARARSGWPARSSRGTSRCSCSRGRSRPRWRAATRSSSSPRRPPPLTALLFAEICAQADLPPGVVNIVTGAGETGAALVNHPDVNKVAFTGSTEVGRQIARSVAGTGKKVTLELGGKAANIVFEDAALDQAVEGIVNGIFFNQGHVCCAGSRLLVQESIETELLDALKRRLGTLRLGDPLDTEHRHRRDQLRGPARQDPRAVRPGRGGGRRALVPGLLAARQGLLVPADHLHRRRPVAPDRPRGGLSARSCPC